MESQIDNERSSIEDIDFDDSSSSMLDSLLFYSPKIFDNIDDKEVLIAFYNEFSCLSACRDEKDERKMLIEALSNKDGVELLLSKYNYTMRDLMTLLCRRMPYLFSTKTYIDKIKNIIAEKYLNV